jgi:hypothetical protein
MYHKRRRVNWVVVLRLVLADAKFRLNEYGEMAHECQAGCLE